jgi:choline dehydrogenase-like flavoprotein
VLVIEAGPDGRSDPKIYIPGLRGSTLGSIYDWNLTTIPQTEANGRVITHNRGRVLGGTSAVNLLVWDRASIREYNSWEELGNPGWNWESMYPAMLEAENFQRTNGTAKYGNEGVAYGGPIQTALLENPPPHLEACIPTLESLGLRQNLESLSGRVLGTMYQPSTNYLGNHTRSYSVSYLAQASDNLIVMFDTHVEKVELDKKGSRATGVLLTDGRVIKAKNEVIISAGTFLSPKLLELSGIGQKDVLAKAGVDQIIDLPGVGENLQDHLRIQVTYQLQPNITGLDIVRYNQTRAQIELDLWRQGLPSLYQYSGSCYGFLTWKEALGNDSKLLQLARSSVAKSNVVDRKKLTLLSKANSDAPQLEVIFSDGYIGTRGYPAIGTPGHGKQYASLLAGVMHPFARGSAHINSSDPNVKPIIDPKFLGSAYDLEAVKEAAKYLRKIGNTAPFKDLWVTEYDPGLSTDTDVEWEKYVRDNVYTLYHPVGTCAMLPKKDNGVVDPTLKVYGVENLRVVDASVIPIIISAHIQTAVYGIAERAAELIAVEYD